MMCNERSDAPSNEGGVPDRRNWGQDLDSKTNDELLAEMTEYIQTTSEYDLDMSIVDAYLDKMDERAPIEEPGDEKAALARLPLHADDETAKPPAKPRKKHRVLAAFGILAAAVALFCVFATAFGHNPIKLASEFAFIRLNPSGNLSLPEGVEADYSSLQDALDKNGIVLKGSPSWIPSDCKFLYATVRFDEGYIRITAYYGSDSREFRMQVSNDMQDTVAGYEEKNLSAKEHTYPSNGMNYTINTNSKTFKATWVDGDYACAISGGLSEKELKRVIDSIE